jgi:mRNA interferase RelE/StbE
MFTVIISGHARKDSKKLSKDVKRKIAEILNYLERNPIPVEKYDVKKIKGMHGIYRIRIGKWRMIYSVNFIENRIIIIRIAQREVVYKDLR